MALHRAYRIAALVTLVSAAATAQVRQTQIFRVPDFSTSSSTPVAVPGADLPALPPGQGAMLLTEGVLTSSLANDEQSYLEVYDGASVTIWMRVGCASPVAGDPQPFTDLNYIFLNPSLHARLVAAPGATVSISGLRLTVLVMQSGTVGALAGPQETFLDAGYQSFSHEIVGASPAGWTIWSGAGLRRETGLGSPELRVNDVQRPFEYAPSALTDGGPADFFINPSGAWRTFVGLLQHGPSAQEDLYLQLNPDLAGTGTASVMNPRFIVAAPTAFPTETISVDGPFHTTTTPRSVLRWGAPVVPGLTYVAAWNGMIRAVGGTGRARVTMALDLGGFGDTVTQSPAWPAGSQLQFGHFKAFVAPGPTATVAIDFASTDFLTSVDVWSSYVMLMGPFDAGIAFVDDGGMEPAFIALDAGSDGGVDAGVDGGVDAGSDGGGDAGVKESPDAGSDAGTLTPDAPRIARIGCGCETGSGVWALLAAAAGMCRRARRPLRGDCQQRGARNAAEL